MLVLVFVLCEVNEYVLGPTRRSDFGFYTGVASCRGTQDGGDGCANGPRDVLVIRPRLCSRAKVLSTALWLRGRWRLSEQTCARWNRLLDRCAIHRRSEIPDITIDDSAKVVPHSRDSDLEVSIAGDNNSTSFRRMQLHSVWIVPLPASASAEGDGGASRGMVGRVNCCKGGRVGGRGREKKKKEMKDGSRRS